MIVQKYAVNSPSCIFLQIPSKITINEDARTKYASSQKIETLMEELREGPVIALGHLGPNSYLDAPFKREAQVAGRDIYGWKPQSTRKEGKSSYAMVVGAQKEGERELVYFVLAQDVTLDRETYVRDYRTSNQDVNVYVTSHKTFSNYLTDLYPLSRAAPAPASSEEALIQQLCSLSLNSILDGKEGERKCRELGQAISDKSGLEGMQRVCKAVKQKAPDGKLREQYISRAWNRVGDWLA